MNPLLPAHAIPIFLLLLSFGSWPYGYFVFLRLAVTICAAAIAYVEVHDKQVVAWAWPFGVIAALFNPVFPVYLSRQIWGPIDAVVAIVFGVHFWMNRATYLRGQ